MEEKSFLKTLRTYFESKKDADILIGNKEDIVIPMEWVFTEQIDREVIQRAMVQVLKEHKPRYAENYVSKNLRDYVNKNQGQINGWQIGEKREELRRQASSQIRELSLKVGRNGLQITINGLDNWTKAIISEQPYKEGAILQISEDEFCEKILGVLKTDSIQDILNSLDISEEDKRNVQTIFAARQGSPIDEFSLNGIKDSMVQAAENLTEYYEYLTEEKTHSEISTITINQRQGTRGANKNISGSSNPGRKSPVYPFVEREQLLRQMNPKHVIYVDGYDQEGKIVKNVYTTFIYENPRGKEGYLLVAEPLEGSHSTRVVYMTKEQFDSFEISEDSSRYGEISKHYLEMANDEFSEQENAVRINHGELDVYSDKMRFVITGEASTVIDKQRAYYNKTLNKIYGQRKLEASDIGALGERALGDDVRLANGVLDAISEPTKEQEIRGETND